jgi:hypothetical protein
MSIEIPAVKLSPELVFGMLDIIDRFEGDPQKVREEIIKYYRSKSLRKKTPSPKNIVRAVTFPSLRHLDLIEGFWPKVSLNPDGKIVLNAYREHGVSEAKRKFGLILCRIDERTGWVIKTLLNLAERNKVTEFPRFISVLGDRFEVTSEKETRVLADRLKRWLYYLEYVGFIEQEKDMIKVNQAIVESCEKGTGVKVSTPQFTALLIKKYKELARQEGSVYVPIPKLRDAVCEETGMLKDEFYEILRSIKFATNRYTIMLSEPMLRQKGGITVGNKYYYYLSIYERR